MKKIFDFFFKRTTIINIHIDSFGTFSIKTKDDLISTKEQIVDSLVKAVSDFETIKS